MIECMDGLTEASDILCVNKRITYEWMDYKWINGLQMNKWITNE